MHKVVREGLPFPGEGGSSGEMGGVAAWAMVPEGAWNIRCQGQRLPSSSHAQ